MYLNYHCIPSTADDKLTTLAASACAGDACACAAVEEYVLAQLELPFADSPNPLMEQVG